MSETRIGSLLGAATVVILLLAGAGPAAAQISGATSSTAGASCSGGGSVDGDCRNTVGFSAPNTGTTFTSRYAWNINADTGSFSTHDTSGNAQHNISFTATAPGGYRLSITTQRIGDINRVSDFSGCSGDADTSGITGSSNVALSSGTLSLGDPGSVDPGAGDAETPFSQSSGTAQIFRVSNGVGQGHSLTFTWNGSVRSNACEASVRQGEDSGTTTGCSACGYPGNPTRTQNSDGHFVTVTFLSLCGNSTVDAQVSEQCDEGPNNGSSTSCCNTNCTFRSAGAVCRVSGGVCDPQETCSGASGTCPNDVFLPSTSVCRASAGACDPAETCPGNGPDCPSDAKSASGTICRASAGVCDPAEVCNGVSNTCPADAKSPSGTVCRASAGICDAAESCDGVSNACPANAFQPSTTICRSSAGICDPAESCTGSSASCPGNTLSPSGTVCRTSTGECDPAEVCSGSSASCPADFHTPNGTACTSDGNPCTLDQCNGVSGPCQHPIGNAGAICRASTGECDPAETCTGLSASCPADAKSPNGTACTDDGNGCTNDTCNGSSALCQHPNNSAPCNDNVFCNGADTCGGGSCSVHAGNPCTGGSECADACNESADNCFDLAGTTCTDDGNVCTNDTCNGTGACTHPNNTAPCNDGSFCNGPDTCAGGSCSVHAGDPCTGGSECADACNESADNCFDLAGTSCTSDSNPCTTDACDGAGTCAHPAGNAGAVCRAAAGVCDVAEVCDGVNTACPSDSVSGAFVICRPAAGECDLAESCTGVGVNCPPDVRAINGTPCTDDGNPCSSDICDGSSVSCQHPAGNAGATCRGSAGVCDVAETCTGSSTSCPADGFQASTVQCRGSAGVCDVADFCTGSSATCPPDAFQPSTTQCRAAAGDCDAAENCTGSSASCPADGFQPDGTACVDGNACTTDACQNGVCVGTQEFSACLDDFNCYKVRIARGTPAFVPTTVTLQDTFETGTFDVKKPKHLCPPADSGNGIVDAATHLETYQIKVPVGGPAHLRQPNIGIRNALGTLHVDTVKADLLLVPTAKSLASSPPAPDPQDHNVDHYKCYKVRTTRGTARFPRGMQIVLTDQFTPPTLPSGKRFDLKAIKHLCTPVSKNGESIKEPSRYLACYKTKPAIGQPVHQPVRVFAHNQFDAERLDTVKEDLVCLPTERL